MDTTDWDNRLIVVRGAREVGKMILMFQYLEFHYADDSQSALYTSLDSLYFTQHTPSELAEQLYLKGGKCLFLDEVHKYPSWGKEVRSIYDESPELEIVFTGSSLFQPLNAEANLSRRCISYDMRGLSYREYLKLLHQILIRPCTLEEILEGSDGICNEVSSQYGLLIHFEGYLKHGYYPFYLGGDIEYYTRIENITNSILETELPQQCGVDISNIRKLKSLLGILPSEVPFMMDIAKLSALAEFLRTIILVYLRCLDKAKLIHLLYSDNDSTKRLQESDKVYMENTSLLYALTFKDVNKSALKEVFMMNQLTYLHRAEYCTYSADYTIGSEYTIEVGGKSKGGKQIVGSGKAFMAAGDIEYLAGDKILL